MAKEQRRKSCQRYKASISSFRQTEREKESERRSVKAWCWFIDLKDLWPHPSHSHSHISQHTLLYLVPITSPEKQASNFVPPLQHRFPLDMHSDSDGRADTVWADVADVWRCLMSLSFLRSHCSFWALFHSLDKDVFTVIYTFSFLALHPYIHTQPNRKVDVFTAEEMRMSIVFSNS